MSALKFSNRVGFPCIESTGATLTSSAETFSFNPHPYLRNYFQGGLFIKISGTQTAPSTAVPIQFSTSGISNSTVPVYDTQGNALTTATWPGDGVYIAWYDSSDSKLRILNS